MQAIKWIFLTIFFNICFPSFSFGQVSLTEPDKHLLIKHKIKKYEREMDYYFNNSDTAVSGGEIYVLNDFGSILSISSMNPNNNWKIVFEYVHDMLPSNKSVFTNNASIATSATDYKYDSDYVLQEELEFDSLDNLINHKIYDKYGMVIEEMENGPESITKKTTKNKYNEQGEILESIGIYPEETTEIVYFYKDGLLIRKESSYDSDYKNYFIEYYIYNENKQLVSQHTRHSNKHKGEKFKLRSSIQYEYNHAGRCIKKRYVHKIENPKDVDDNKGFSIDDFIDGESMISTYDYNEMGLISNIFVTDKGKPNMIYNFKYFQ